MYTTLAVHPETRERIYRLKGAGKSNETFLNELCDIYERKNGGKPQK